MSDFYHHGILGQKWGVRRTPEQLGHRIKYKDKTSVKTKSGKTISLTKIPDSKFIKFLERHVKSVAEEISKTANFQIKSSDGKKIGDLTLYKEAEDSINIVWLGINQKERGKGYATAVMKTAIDIAKDTGCSKVTLEVPGNSPDARHVYEKLGFKEVSSPDIDPDDIWGGLTNMELRLKPKSIKHSDESLIQVSDELKASFLEKLVSEIDRLDMIKQGEHGVPGMKWGVRRYQIKRR